MIEEKLDEDGWKKKSENKREVRVRRPRRPDQKRKRNEMTDCGRSNGSIRQWLVRLESRDALGATRGGGEAQCSQSLRRSPRRSEIFPRFLGYVCYRGFLVITSSSSYRIPLVNNNNTVIIVLLTNRSNNTINADNKMIIVQTGR